MSDVSSVMNAADRAALEMQVNAFNSSLEKNESVKRDLGKDEFMQILITQLKHQDPTKPMEDREFIAQMAQFSSLEQMTSMSAEFSQLSSVLKGAQALNLVGKEVEITRGGEALSGRVESVTTGAFPQVLVNGAYYDYEDITEVGDAAL